MDTLEQAKRSAADLYWLASLLTGSREIAAGVTIEAVFTWMHPGSRRLLIGKALTTVREDLAASARRTAWMGSEESALPPRSWALDQGTTKSDLERALLSIDVFPRAALLLLIFEAVPLKDAAILLNAGPDLVRRAQAAGARELTINLARMQGWNCAPASSNSSTREWDHA
jgi:DNA-directed RNA polymerase specialized sigma24 family protein